MSSNVEYISQLGIVSNSTKAFANIHVQGKDMFENVQNPFEMFKSSNYSLNISVLIFSRLIASERICYADVFFYF